MAVTTTLLAQIVYSIGSLIGIAACFLVWFGQGDFFRTYGVYGVAALFGLIAFTSSLVNRKRAI